MPKLDVFMLHDFGYPAFVESAKLAEANGFENFWLIDSPPMPTPTIVRGPV